LDGGFVAISRRKVTADAIQQIVSRIAAGAYLPGQKLPPERELSETLNVSRPTLREVILALGTLGVLETRHGTGTYVSSLGSEGLALPLTLILEVNQGALTDLIQIRLMLEVGAAEAAARNIGDAALAQLGEIRRRAVNAIDDIEAFVDEDIAFHRVIHVASNNGMLLVLMDSLAAVGRRSRLVTARHRDVRESTLGEHEAIHHALSRHSPDAAAAMKEHLSHVARALTSDSDSTEGRL
jgi:GntR family transcriptional regulator, transcriptional repressor for pyruvate dehydrogenase complex